MVDFVNFIIDNNVVNVVTFRVNGNKTGKNTDFYKKHKQAFDGLLSKHETNNLLEAALLELEKIKKKECLLCGSITKFSPRQKDYLQCCSKKCQSKLSNDNRVATYLEKYGTKHPMQNSEIKDKQKNTNQKRYGVNNVFETEEVKTKAKKTLSDKYGVSYYSQSKEFDEKTKSTNNRRYGVDYPSQNEKIKAKIRNTLIERYGSNTHQPIQNYQDLNSKFIIENLTNDDGHLEIKDVLDHFQCSRNFWVTNIRPLVDGKVIVKSTYKGGQNEILSFIKQNYNGPVYQDDRKCLSGLELDIYLPERKFAVEYNGTYWHSFGSNDMPDKGKHLRKTELCERQNTRLFHVWEHDWKHPKKNKILKSMISNQLGLNTKIYARKCQIVELDISQANDFCNANHIQGNARSSIRYGLIHHGQLVFVMTFGRPRYNKDHKWELMRSCSLLNHTIIGGFQRLMKHFTVNYDDSIISYANRNYSSGNVYKNSGFKELKPSPPAQYYWKPNTDTIINRYQAQKHKLKNLLEEFDPTISEQQNMLNNGYRIMWDCGNKVFSYINQGR